MLMYGTTMFFVEVADEPAPHPRLWTTAGVDPGTYRLAAGMATSGALTGWLQELAGGVPFDDAGRGGRARSRPARTGCVVLPYFAGERTPMFDPLARGVIAGLTLRHGRGHLFRAVYEGIAFGVRQILELIDERRRARPQRLVAVGGGTQGGLWTQIVSDVTGRAAGRPAADDRRELRRRAAGRHRRRTGAAGDGLGQGGAVRGTRSRACRGLRPAVRGLHRAVSGDPGDRS